MCRYTKFAGCAGSVVQPDEVQDVTTGSLLELNGGLMVISPPTSGMLPAWPLVVPPAFPM